MDLRYPIGRFRLEGEITQEQIATWIREIEEAPSALRQAVAGLTEGQLDTPYRPEGWTVRQVVHHLADSHINSFVRFKLALTEENPVIKPYFEERWADLADGRTAPIAPSLALLEALHQRWVVLLRSLAPADRGKTFRHPEYGERTLDRTLGLYAWHGKHHIAHITSLRERMGW
jgi:hypothetical protein